MKDSINSKTNQITKKKLLMFHPALAPYRIDQFNHLDQLFDFTVVFTFDNLWNHKFDQKRLLSQAKFKYSYLLIGPHYKGRVFRFGILSTIKKIKPDIVLGYEYSFTTLYLIFLKIVGLISQKIGSTIDDSIYICNSVQSKTRYRARKFAVNKLDYLIVLSTEVSVFYQDEFNLDENQIVVSPILQNTDRLRNDTNQLEILANKYAEQYQLFGKKVLLFVGRFIPEKALTNFISTSYRIFQEQKDLMLVIVGDGAERENIEAKIKDKNLENKIILAGRFEGIELYSWYLCASGFVIPSTYEPFGTVVNEALIFGLKCLCSRYAGASSLMQTDSGIIFDPLSEENTCEKLIEFIDSVDQLEDISLSKKPSLMQDHHIGFCKEWGKILND
jgi:glycosyltransferase involved in cell wall biosynthesis